MNLPTTCAGGPSTDSKAMAVPAASASGVWFATVHPAAAMANAATAAARSQRGQTLPPWPKGSGDAQTASWAPSPCILHPRRPAFSLFGTTFLEVRRRNPDRRPWLDSVAAIPGRVQRRGSQN
jgi:hypothetical protein